MKRIIYSLSILAVMASCNQSGPTEKKASQNSESASVTQVSVDDAATMKFEKESYDFGKIMQGEKVSYDFTFVNTGKTPLIISDAVGSCGCTVPDNWPKEPVAPGKSGKISVVFDSAGKEGVQDKVVTITANTIPADNKIHLIGEVSKSK